VIDYTDKHAVDKRLDVLIASVPKIVNAAVRKLCTHDFDSRGNGRDLMGIVTMFSGGKDSTVLAHLMRDITTVYGHANTGIGIEATREYVRETSAKWGVELIERTPRKGRTYAEYVERNGFPGPGRHGIIFNRIKGDPFAQIRDEFVSNPMRDRVLFVAGRRFTESARRKSRKIPVWERQGSIVWVSPMRGWTNLDLVAYRRRFPEIPRNVIADQIDMSGECLCGAFAKPGELDLLRAYAPAASAVAEIDRLASLAERSGVDPGRCRWGQRPSARPCLEGCNL
jgi:3'-phosphoadenosine 5'-phosphosulfate sulfotransferase (PAPS reductase)/FAD synthetase